MESTSLFRKVALERMSSPEQLDRLLQVTAPRSWLGLLSLVCLLLAAIAWGFLGEVRTTVSAQGALLRSGAGEVEARLYVPVASGNEIRPLMETRVFPATGGHQRYGFIHGRVLAVSDAPVVQARQDGAPEVPGIVTRPQAAGPLTEVRIALDRDERTPSGYRWSSGSEPPPRLSDGTSCVAEIVIRKEKPITLVFPHLGDRPSPR